MTAKEYVKSKVPHARSERHRAGRIKGMQETYYLIRDSGHSGYISSGKTESNAWANAKRFLLEKEKEMKEQERETENNTKAND